MSHLRECNGTHRRSSGAAILLLLGLLAWTLPSLLPTVAVGADPNEFLVFNYVRESDGAVGMPGRLFVPPGYNPGQAYPLVVFYHGWGERGTNNTSQVNSNINNLLANAKTRNFFIYAPQAGDPGWNLTAVEASMRMVGWALRQYRIDPTRIYTTGVSNGGNATYNAMSNYADVLAGGVPICGNGADALKDAQLARRPLWLYHARDDGSIPVGQSRTRVNAIRTIALAGPAIDRIADAFAEDIASASPGMAITLHGQRFGSKVPKAWLEHVDAKTGAVRRLKLKTLRPLAHADAKGKPAASAMEPNSGASTLGLVLPGAFPKGWDHAATHDLVIDNGIGIATFPFATHP